MRTFDSCLSRRRLIGFAAVAALLFGLAMLHPYPRQSLFGPTIHGKPWCVWETQIRRQFGEQPESWSTQISRWLGFHRPQIAITDFNDPTMLPLVIAMLDDPDPLVRALCLDAIISFPNLQDRSALPALRKAYYEDECELRLSAGLAIWMIDKDKEVVLWSLSLLKHHDPEVRSLTIRYLAALSADAPELFPHIIAHAKDNDHSVRMTVMYAMIHFGTKGVPILIDGMRDADPGVRYSAALSVEQIRPIAREATPALEACLQDRDPNVPAAAWSALRVIDPERFKQLKEEGK